MKAFCFACSVMLLLCACGPKLPPRFVVERDLESARYRRYQQVLDVEIPIAKNPAVGHTATYAVRGKTLLITPVFVTVYERARGLTETIRARLRSLTGYELRPYEAAGENVWLVRGESGDRWITWVSSRHFVKIGIPEGAEAAPETVLETYLDLYPSDLDEKGHALEDADSSGPAISEESQATASP